MKKTITALMATALMLTSAPAVFAADGDGVKFIAPEREVMKLHSNGGSTFRDMGGHFAADAVRHLGIYNMIGNGKVGGKDLVFAPNTSIDRIELKAWIKNTLGKDVQENGKTGAVSRLEVATWIASALPPLNTGINGANITAPYTDTPNLTTAERDALNLLYKVGIMVGDGQGHFNPKGVLTRGEAAVLLDQSLNRSLAVAPKADYEVVSGQLPETVQTVANENRTEPGVYSVVDNGVRYLVVCAGEAPTGGYSVLIDGVKETEAGIFVGASMLPPEPGMMVPQMITYPQMVLKVKNTEKFTYLAE